MKFKVEVCVTDEGAGKRGCGCPHLGPDILFDVPVGIFVWVRDVVDDPTHWEGVGRIPPQGVPQADREATSAREGRRVDTPPLEDAMAEAGMQEVDTYVSLCHNTFTQFIATSPIVDLCLEVERRLGPQVSRSWW